MMGQPGPAGACPTHLGVVGDGALGHRALFLHQEAEPSPLFRQSCLVAIRDVVFQLALLVADGFDVLEEREEQGGGCRQRCPPARGRGCRERGGRRGRGPRHGTHTCACTAPQPALTHRSPPRRGADSARGLHGTSCTRRPPAHHPGSEALLGAGGCPHGPGQAVVPIALAQPCPASTAPSLPCTSPAAKSLPRMAQGPCHAQGHQRLSNSQQCLQSVFTTGDTELVPGQGHTLAQEPLVVPWCCTLHRQTLWPCSSWRLLWWLLLS